MKRSAHWLRTPDCAAALSYFGQQLGGVGQDSAGRNGPDTRLGLPIHDSMKPGRHPRTDYECAALPAELLGRTTSSWGFVP
jgi:hypothetical protein